MRKLIMFNLVTIDGYFEGPNHDISWHNVDEEFNDFAHEQLELADLLIFGRITYELMASFWPSEMALKEDPVTAKYMNEINKIVVSKTLDKADWQNTTLIKDKIEDKVKELKEQEGKDIYIFGSSNLSVTLANAGLIDEYRIMLNPVFLGNGTSLLKGVNKVNLKLVNLRQFKNGNVLHYYEVIK
jgi:dihydrofolate reductase